MTVSPALTLVEARAVMRQMSVPLPPRPTPLDGAAGAYLTEAVVADTDHPPFDRSAMDGYAVADVAVDYTLAQVIPAGTPQAATLSAGTCARVFTGAPVPSNTLRVFKQEDVSVTDDRITPRVADDATHVRRRGDDCRAGDTLLTPGTRLGPAQLALCASVGVTTVSVAGAVRVAIVTTGDELVDPASTPGPGQVRDVNSILLRTSLPSREATVIASDRLPDDAAALRTWVDARLSENVDLLLLSGGASVGDHDHARSTLAAAGFHVHFERLQLRPGAPFVFATRGAVTACVIPGNPVSHIACVELLVRPLLDHLRGGPGADPARDSTLAAPFESSAVSRETWWPARECTNGMEVLPWNGSGHLAAFGRATALVRIPPGTAALPAASPVRWVPLP